MTVVANAPTNSTNAEIVSSAVEELVAAVERSGTVSHQELLNLRFDAGLAWVQHPVGEGGLGVEAELQELVMASLFDHGLLDVSDQRVAQRGLFGPVLMRYGTAEQRARHLRPIFTESERWCQLFSEPDAGSDLAGVRTEARRDGDVWVVNGQKVWTTMAHHSKWGLLLARSDPTASKHAGVTAFLVDMKAPGVEVRALRQLTGDAEFNEVFLIDVVVPDTDRVGDVGEGWNVIKYASSNERQIIGQESTIRGSGPISEALDAWDRRDRDDPVLRDRLVRLWIDAEVTRLTSQRMTDLNAQGLPAPSPLATKVAYTSFLKNVYSFIVDLMGCQGLLFPDAYEFKMHEYHSVDGHDPRWNFLAARGRSIGGGTSEILRNTLAERELQLPREPRGSA